MSSSTKPTLLTRKLLVIVFAVAVVAAAGFAAERRSAAQGDLKVTFGNQGVQRLTYHGVTLEDLTEYPEDVFHIWHMKVTDLAGKAMPNAGWGETNREKTWDPAAQTWTYRFAWGSIQVHFVAAGDALTIDVVTKNAENSGVIVDGAVIYPLALHFAELPKGFHDGTLAQMAFNTTGPSVTLADFGSGEVAAVVSDAAPLYSGFQPTGRGISYTPILSGTAPDGLAVFQPHFDRPLRPGQTDHFTLALRFAPSGTPVASLAGDAFREWAKAWPSQLAWKDRRVIGTVYLASSPSGAADQPGGYLNNPRRYFNESNAESFDVTTATGLAQFQAKVMKQAEENVRNMRRLNAQGAITWDVEGEQYPQDTSYVCSPDQIATVAPEMESVIRNGSAYAGMKLDDAYFKVMRDAGYRVGVCVRPQRFLLRADGTATQSHVADADVVAELVRKMKYAHDRWGATIFYLDSTVEPDGAPLDAGIFQQAAAELPDSLLIPEETTAKAYAYTAPFRSFLFHGDVGTDASVRGYYPNAFSANLINDVDPAKLSAAVDALTKSVGAGDVLMVHADYWQGNNDTVVRMYREAKAPGSRSPH